jgi:hypothetical protein
MHSAYEIQHDIFPAIRRQILEVDDVKAQDALFTLLALTEEMAGLLYGLIENLQARP